MVGYRLLEASERAAGPIDRAGLADLYRHPDPGNRAWIRTNFVTTIDGAVQGTDGRSGSINTKSDTVVFALQRALADVVLVGAGTARTEGYRAVDLQPWQRELRADLGLSPFPTLAIVSSSCALEEDLSTDDGECGPVLILTSDSSRERRPDFRGRTEVVELPGAGTVPVPELIKELTRRGLRRILCEGGPRLNWELHAAGLVDDVCITISPMIIGGDGKRSTSGPLLGPESYALAHTLAAEDDALLLRYLRTSAAQAC